MKCKNYILIFFVTILLFSCIKKKERIDKNIQQETDQASIEVPVIEVETNKDNGLNNYFALDDEMRELIRSKLTTTEEEKEAMKEYLYKNDESYKKYGYRIIFIEKINFGIPRGKNWIVRLNNRGVIIYAINGELIEKRYYSTSFNLDDESEFNIMQNIPGTRIDNSTSSFGDFNGDGIDEIFEYGFYGRGSFILIWGYDKAKDDYVDYCEIPFKIIDPKNGPAPVEFMTYRGMFGLKVYYSNNEVAGGIGWVSDPDSKNGKWIFYTWDAEQKKYIEIGEVD